MEQQPTVGVVVARLQVPQLHKGHLLLLDTASNENDQLLVVLGVTGGQPTATDPLDAETRTQMILQKYPHAIVCPLLDTKTNEAWSTSLDQTIEKHAPNARATLYGSRDCFANCYSGALPFRHIPEVPHVNGTEQRANTAKRPLRSKAFRRGAIYATANRFPTAYQAVDGVVIRQETNEVLLGWKSGDDGLRFPGGFLDPQDESLEAAVKREVFEETNGMEIGAPVYIGSVRINDVRYRKGPDTVMSAVFIAPYLFGALMASDDLEGLKWVRVEDVDAELMLNHKPIWQLVQQHLNRMENKS